MMALAPVGVGSTQEAKHSSFTIDQIAEHLGLGGGNWEASFDEKCFLGFIITETSSDGVSTKKYYWSLEASKKHEFHFMHHVASSTSGDEHHNITLSSTQIGEWTEKGSTGIRISGGGGFICDTNLPSLGKREQRIMQNNFRPKIDEPTLLYSWTSDQTKQAIQVDVIFVVDKKEPEALGAGQPATKPADKPAVKDQPSTPTPNDVPR